MKKKTGSPSRNTKNGNNTQEKTETVSLITGQEETVLSLIGFIKIEKNLATLGFFTPSNKNIKTVKKKTVSFTRFDNGKKVETSATIVPSVEYGLPTTADQDKYLALQKIVTDMYKQSGMVSNPIAFTSTEILELLEQTDGGKNFQEVGEFLDRMYFTSIISQGAVYLAGKKAWAKDRFRVFDRVISVGKEIESGEIESGKVADKNYVWLSEWQLENINNNHLLPVDFDIYKQLKNSVAKAIVPLLQVWLYVTREQGFFEKRYEEICQHLGVRQYQKLSDIRRKLSPSFDELVNHGYLSKWLIKGTNDKKGYKIVFYHGEKFYQDRIKRIEQREQASSSTNQQAESNNNKNGAQLQQEISGDWSDPKDKLVNKLVDRGVDRRWATSYVGNVSTEALPRVEDLIEYFDWIVSRGKKKVRFPGGFLRTMLEEEWNLPSNFKSCRRQVEQAKFPEQVSSSDSAIDLLEADKAYWEWWDNQVDAAIAAKSQDEQKVLGAQVKEEMQQKFSAELTRWPSELKASCFQQMLRKKVAAELKLASFEEWLQTEKKLSAGKAVKKS